MTPAQLAEVFAPYGESLVTVPVIKYTGTVLFCGGSVFCRIGVILPDPGFLT
jgi:hypothetical protein